MSADRSANLIDRAKTFFRTWQGRLVLLLLAFSVIPLILLLIVYSSSMVSVFERNQLASLTAIARAKSATIGQFNQDRRSEVERIVPLLAAEVRALKGEGRKREESRGELPGLRAEGALLVDERDVSGEEDQETEELDEEPDRAAESARLRSLREDLQLILWDQSKFEELLIIDTDGDVLVSTHAPHEVKSASELEYFRSGQAATYTQPVFESPITGKLSMVISTPMRESDGEAIAVFAARLNLDRLFRIVNDSTGLGDTGEIVVGKVIQDQVVFMAPTRHDPAAALTRRVPIGSAEAKAIQDGAAGQSGAAERIDYRGEPVFAAWHRIPQLEWGLVAKADRHEVMKPVRTALLQLVLIVLFMTAVAVFASFLAARALVRPLHQLREAADQISKGDIDVEVDINSQDEIGELASSFERMIAAIRFFRAEARSGGEEDDADEESRS